LVEKRQKDNRVAPWALIVGAILIAAAVLTVVAPLYRSFDRLSARVLPSMSTPTLEAAVYILIHAAIAFLGLVLIGVFRSKPKDVLGAEGEIGLAPASSGSAEKRPGEEDATDGDERADGGGGEGLGRGGQGE